MPEKQLEDQAIFEVARNIEPSAARETYIHQMCGEDLGLEQRVKALLQAFAESDSFLESPPSELEVAATRLEPVRERVGTKIGPYKLLQQIGEGGMGSVYMAEQIEPVERRVAVKIIKPGMDTKAVIARFEAERQALAMMDHPGIAKVLDVGTTHSGRPYFVMELVRGVPITQYCDEHQLTPRQRLELFLPVCQAVQHAHQKGIIHRDIKPSNVLVAEYDDRPVPKIIDFGLAKAMEKRLTDKTMFTEFGQIVGTPDYMSPEQAKLNHLDIDTRSDIYSLGVLLYELLSGNTPFDRQRLRSAAFDELLRIIREEEPPKPSLRLSSVDTLPSIAANRHIAPAELTRQLSGELDWIVMKSLEKDRTRRYETASKFVEDVQHYLNDEPVVACPPSSTYRFKKFAQRNKVAFATASLVAAALMIGIVGTSWQAIRATYAANRATAAEQLAQRRLTQEQQARREADQARKEEARQRRLAVASQEHASNNLILALAALDDIYLNAIGEERLLSELLQHNEVPITVNRISRAFSEEERELLRRGLGFYQRFAAANQDSDDAALHVARANYRVGSLRAGLGQFDSARVAFKAAVGTFQDIVAKGDADAALYSELAKSQQGLAATLDWDGSRESLEEADRSCSEAIRLNPLDAALYDQRGEVRWQLDDENAIDDFERAMELEPENVSHHLTFAAWYALGISSVRDYEKAMLHAERAVQLAPDNARTHSAIARVLMNRDRSAGLQRILEHLDRALELDADDFWSLEYRAQTLSELGGDHEIALVDANNAVRLLPNYYRGYFRRAMVYHGLEEYKKGLADCDRAQKLAPLSPQPIRARGMILLEQEKFPEAIAEFSRAIELRSKWATLYHLRADAHERVGDHQSAIEDYTVGFSLTPDEIPRSAIWILKRRAESYAALGKFEEAAADYEKAIELDPGKTTGLLYRLRTCYRKLGRLDQMIALFDRAIKIKPLNARSWHGRGDVFRQLGRYEDAIADYNKTLELDPDYDWARLNRGNCQLQLGHHDLARRDYLATLELEIDDGGIVFTRGEQMLKLGLAEQALGDFERAIVLAPNKTHYRKRAGLAHFKLGQFDEAIRDLEVRLNSDPSDTSTIVWIPPALVAKCKDESFKSGMIALADQLVETSDRKGDALVARSKLLLALEDRERALLDLEQATEEFSQAEPSFDECYQRYSAALLYLQFGENEKYQDSAHDMQQRFATTEDSRSQNFVAWTAVLAADAVDDYSTVLALAEKAVAAEPENDQFQKTLAAARFRSGRYESARELLTEIAERDENPDAKANSSPAYGWYFLAMAEQALGQEMEARTFLRKAEAWTDRKLSAGIQPLAWNRKLTLELLQDEAEASLGLDATDREELIAAFYADPPPADSDAQYWVDRGKWHHGRQEHEKSFADFTEAIRIDPSLRTAFDLRALAENCLGKHEEAILDATEAIRLAPNAAYAYEQRGWAYNELEQYEDAIVDLSEAIRLNPSFYFAYVRRHLACVAVGKQEMALADAKKIFELGPAAAILHETKGRWRQAADVYQTLFRLQPDDPRYWQRYANALLASGQSEQHREFCAELIEQFGQTSDPGVALEIILCLIIVPDAVDDWSVPLRLGELLLASENPEKLSVIGLLMRAGEYQRAIQLSREANQEAGGKLKSIPRLWTGLAHHGLGELGEAKGMLRQAKECDAETPNVTNMVQYQMLYRELSDLAGEEVHEQTDR